MMRFVAITLISCRITEQRVVIRAECRKFCLHAMFWDDVPAFLSSFVVTFKDQITGHKF